MCELPQYQRLPLEDKSEVAVSHPVQHGSTSTPAGDRTGQVVEFIFEPRWPVRGHRETAIGVMGQTKEDTLSLVRQAFPVLDEYADERIEFLMMTVDASPPHRKEQWSRVLVPAWNALLRDPPKKLQVRVADLPGDAKRRTRKELLTVLAAVLLPMISMLMLFGLLALWADWDD